MTSPRAVLTNPLDNFLGYHLRRASQAVIDDLVVSLAELNLRPTSGSVLLLVGANPGITQSGVGAVLGIERANMVPMTNKLMKQGLVFRTRADGRSHGLLLTEEGKRMLVKLRRRITEHENAFFGKTQASERAQLLKVLRGLWLPQA